MHKFVERYINEKILFDIEMYRKQAERNLSIDFAQ